MTTIPQLVTNHFDLLRHEMRQLERRFEQKVEEILDRKLDEVVDRKLEERIGKTEERLKAELNAGIRTIAEMIEAQGRKS